MDVTAGVAMGALLVVARSTCVVDVDIDLVVTERCAGDVSCAAVPRCDDDDCHDIGTIATEGEDDRGEHAFGVCGLVLPGVIAIALTSQPCLLLSVACLASGFRTAAIGSYRSALRCDSCRSLFPMSSPSTLCLFASALTTLVFAVETGGGRGRTERLTVEGRSGRIMGQEVDGAGQEAIDDDDAGGTVGTDVGVDSASASARACRCGPVGAVDVSVRHRSGLTDRM